MIKCKTIINKEAKDLLVDISLSIPRNKRIQIIETSVFLFLAVILLLVALCVFLKEGMTPLAVRSCLYGVAFLLFGIFAKKIQRAMLKHMMNKSEKDIQKRSPNELLNDNEREYVFSEDNVIVKSKIAESTYNWSAFRSWENRGHYICISLFNNTIILVDKNTLSDEEIGELFCLLNKKIKDTNKEKRNKKAQ